ncbi:hypothetical protein X801_10306 [Opisthorchis viverrini]|uniref:Uncharacterized protein n=1 Tax=Opisthorchis viverrini TaxID=6198 RepID=A0A1S8WHI5_OPIVI|nr:hypothetical protein X801_10306 [Opisthorchis viverrini]
MPSLVTEPTSNQASSSTVECSEVPLDKGSKLSIGHRAVYNYLEVLLRLGSDSFKAEIASLDKHTDELARSVGVQQVPLPRFRGPKIRASNSNPPGLLLSKPSTDKSSAPSIRIPKFRKQRRSAVFMGKTTPAGTRRKPALQERQTTEVDLDSLPSRKQRSSEILEYGQLQCTWPKSIVEPGDMFPLAILRRRKNILQNPKKYKTFYKT